MKNLKKFVALLLAGVMAMVMLTACSGGGTSADTEKEEAIRKQLGKRTEATSLCDRDGKVENDSQLYKKLQSCWIHESRLKPVHLVFSLLILMLRASTLWSSM